MSVPGGRLIALSLSALLVAVPANTLACTPVPPPPPPESQQAWESDEQFAARVMAHNLEQQFNSDLLKARVSGYQEGYEAGLWELAPVVVLAEVIEKGETALDSSRFGAMPQVTLKVVKVARGSPSDNRFTITYAGIGSCGPVGMVSVAQGNVGDIFALFARTSDLGMQSVIAGYARREAKSARTRQLFEN